jgi:hypothetical protein
MDRPDAGRRPVVLDAEEDLTAPAIGERRDLAGQVLPIEPAAGGALELGPRVFSKP